ncbi:epsin [Chloropicon primus]|nr:epsin [Chloropicon primus]
MKGFAKALEKVKEGDYGGAIRSVQQRVKQVALDMTDLEVLVEEATNSEPWGPHGKVMAKIASESARSEENFREVMGVLVDRITAAWKKPKQWRWAYKSLLVLEYIIKNGPEQVVVELTDDESMDIFSDLTNFEFVEEHTMKDHGINVRKRAGDIMALLKDPERLMEEREVARKSKSKLGGHGRSTSPQSLYESENRAGWGKQRTLRSGATRVRTKPSFTVPTPVRMPEESQPQKVTPSKIEDSPSADFLGLGDMSSNMAEGGAAAEAGVKPSGLTPVKGDAAPAQRKTSSGTQQKGKAKFLSETKVNPKIKLSLSGFKPASTLSAPPQNATLGDAGLMSLSDPNPAPNASGAGEWASFNAAEMSVASNSAGWATFESPVGGKTQQISDLFAQASISSQPAPTMTGSVSAGGLSGAVPQQVNPLPTGANALDPFLFSAAPATTMQSHGNPMRSSTAPQAPPAKEDPFKELLQ